MKACIVVLDSLTGNTVITAELIKRGILEQYKGDITVDILNIRSKDTNFATDTIAQAELLGFGTPTICYKPTPSVLEWLQSKLPSECITRKSFFTFATYGTHPGICAYEMADTLLQRGCSCQHIGIHEAFTPDTYMWFLPRKGEPQMKWSVSSMRSCKAFGAHIIDLYCSQKPVASPFRPSFLARVLAALPPAAVKAMLGDVTVDPSLCVGCGVCARGCPAGALRMEKRQGDCSGKGEIPVWDSEKCISCVHCVQNCGKGALCVPTSEKRVFYDARGVDVDGIETVDDASGQTKDMILRHVATGAFSRPLQSIKGILMYVWALILMVVGCVKGSSHGENKKTK